MTRTLLVAACAALALVPGARAQEPDDNPRLRWEDAYRRRAYPFERIPPNALQRARAQLAATRGARLLGAPPPISGTQWQPLGPNAIPLFGTSVGRMSAIAVHPTNASVIYVGGAQGGVWKTVDGGASWTPLTDRECSLAMGSIALDPVNPDIVYAGTGEQHFSGDSYYGCGLLRSTDGGATWTRLGASAFAPGAGGARISRVVLAPSTAGTPATTTVFAASDLGLFRSTDGGGTWSELLVGALGCSSFPTCAATDLVIHPTNDSILYAAIRTRGVYKTVDRGATWTALPSGFPTAQVGRINLALTPTAPDTLYASVHNTSTSQLLGIWRTLDGGGTWTPLAASGASCGSQCWYDMYITVHPTTPTTIYFGGVSLYRSTDAGATFQNITSFIHVDQHLMTFDPQDPQTVYAANDGGIYRSTNGGTSWTSLNTGLELTQFYEGISLHPSDRTIVLGGTQDNGTLQYTGVPNWLFVLGADGGYTAIDHDNPTVRYAETQWTANSGFGGPRRSDGGGFVLKVNGIAAGDRAQFIPPLVMDPVNAATLYFGTYRLYRTTDRAESWTAISPDLTGGSGTITAIAPAPTNRLAVYVGTNNGLLQLTTDGGASWAPRTSGLPNRFVQDIAVDRADWQTAYVAVSGFGTGHVFRTVNGGQTWNDVSGALPDVPVNAVILDPASRGIVLIGTDLGVFMSADSGGTWAPLDQGLPNVAVYDIAYNPATATLIAATHGRGMFQLQLDRVLTLAVVPGTRRDTVTVGATAPRSDSAAVLLTGTNAATATWNATHGSAAWLTLGTSGGTGSGRVTWTRSPAGLTAGIYVDTITVAAPGAVDSPWRLVDSLVVQGTLALDVSPASRSDTVTVGATVPRADSAAVLLSGTGASTATWSAAANRGVWITVTTGSGTGPGTARWTRNPAGRAVGVHVDTITITSTAATGSPARIVDSLVVRAAAVALNPTATSDTAVSGTAGARPGSAQLLLSGGTDSITAWTATHGAAPWLTLLTTAGQGSGTISWTRSAADLADGVFRDTITVVSAAGDSARVVDVFVVRAPAVAAACAASHLLGETCLDPTQRRWLDLAGNRDGQFNLGDFVAFVARGSGTGAPPPPRKEGQ